MASSSLGVSIFVASWVLEILLTAMSLSMSSRFPITQLLALVEDFYIQGLAHRMENCSCGEQILIADCSISSSITRNLEDLETSATPLKARP